MNAGTEGRPIADEADARGCLAAMSASEETLFGWARANGVSASHLYRWRQMIAGLDGRGIGDEADARGLLAAWAESGRSFAEWCRGEKVSMEALRLWRRRIEASRPVARRGQRSAPPAVLPIGARPIRLVEITAMSCVNSPPDPSPSSARYEVQVGRCRVLVGSDFDDAVLARVLRVASAC